MREALEFAAAAVGRVLEVHALHDGQGPWRLTVERAGGVMGCVLRTPTPRIDASMVATGAAALKVAEQHGLPAPRLIAADLAVPATLETLVVGTSDWPVGSADQLRAAGAALAWVHGVVMGPREYLPFRPRPIAVDDFAADRRTGRMPTTPLLQAADELVSACDPPTGPAVFLHGDVWPGNLVWNGPVLIDWKTAGVGAPGVDVCELRKQVAITFGPDAPDQVLAGWEDTTGSSLSDVAYWDAVAALNTRTELWGDATARRDAFLRRALGKL